MTSSGADRGAEAGAEEISIGELAARTGVSGSALRSWERRIDFPRPARTVGGQRRYRPEDAALVSRVVQERARGLSLAAAVAAIRRTGEVGAGSLFAGVRTRHPHLEVLSLGFATMRSLTSAIEDECLVRATQPLLFGCFQDQHGFEASGARWRELARLARRAVVLSDFDASDLSASPSRVSLPASAPMLNEWAVVCLDAEVSVALIAWERPRTSDDDVRRFEALLSLDPIVVQDAASICAQVATEAGAPGLEDVAAAGPGATGEDPQRAAALLRRFVTYADGRR